MCCLKSIYRVILFWSMALPLVAIAQKADYSNTGYQPSSTLVQPFQPLSSPLTPDDDTKKVKNKESYEPKSSSTSTSTNSGQEIAGAARDGVYDRVIAQEREPLPYENIREADVFWQKRIWRIIDTKQKMNHSFSAAQQPFIKVLLDVIEKNPSGTVYADESFKTPLNPQDLNLRLGSVDTVTVIDPETYAETKTVVKNDFDWSTVTRFRIKEDWIFDKQISTMVVRILGIAPIREVYDKNTGELRGTEAMFWAYFPAMRSYLAKYEVYNSQNDAVRMSWDDLLNMRYFASYIYKESNMQDRRISDYKTGRDALLEGEEIKNKIFTFEHNLWEY